MRQVPPEPTTSPELACPACARVLRPGLNCDACGRHFPIVCAIPDLRLAYEDPYVSRDEDLRRARALEARFDELDLAGLLREHWHMTGAPPELIERFVAGDLVSPGRSEGYLAALERERGEPLGPNDRFLEVGCGTAALAAAAAGRGCSVVASDASLRWLVVANKRLAELGVASVQLLCFTGEAPPFAPGSFDVVAASDVIEHVADQEAFVRSLGRLLRPDGLLFLVTPNRFSLGLEPHVRLWGVGFLPRGLARRYVRLVRKTPYEHVRLLSERKLRRLLAAQGLDATIEPPEISAATQRLYRGAELALVRAYNRVRLRAVARRLLLAVGPFFHVYARKGV